ncbi:hypothetical protein WICPIJ_003844 [Wickerhamomyces pijperi]|uniref:DNA polymerase alpha subunit B n=1 Tax=Wickerhamomyces pijperi TaxID=599730 RepID=A0A9P8Q6U8_WICPI|nr:hypothetical protein WICPIJ_003844 [Wickerhamomyces pijperi]
MSNQFTKHFGPKLPEDLIPKLEHLLKIFSISAEELYINWETFVTIRNDNNDTFDLANFNKLEQYIQEKLAKKSTARTPTSLKIRKLKTKNASSPLNLGSSPTQYESSLTSPAVKRMKTEETPSISTSTTPLKHELITTPLPSSPFRPIQSPGEVIESLNDTLKITPEYEAQSVSLTASFDESKYNFRSMRMKLLEAADVLDDQIDSMSSVFAKHYQIVLSNPTLQSQDEVSAVGRIVSDNPTVLEGLNSQSLCLETSRLQGVGKRIPLDLTRLEKFEFFPGQIVCLKGKNPTGQTFHVVEVLPPPILGPSVLGVDELVHERDTDILVFKGPFTLNSELNFDIFTKATEDIMNNCNSIVLMGPFIDFNNKAIKTGAIPEEFNSFKTLEDIYIKVVLAALRKINQNIEIIVIPDVKDIVSRSSSYPQKPYPKPKKFKNYRNFPNPALFQINDISIGVSNVDIFRNLKDIIGKSSNPNRFERIVNYIIEQRKFFPLFPSLEPLDVPYLGLTEFQSVPDVLILPSDLKPFAKIIKNVLVINPGSFIKPNNGGSYVRLSIQRANQDNTEAVEDGVINKIWERAKVEIIKT